ncbi:hypothetical protein QFZ48_005700 [Chitinophaga sp. W2I13]
MVRKTCLLGLLVLQGIVKKEHRNAHINEWEFINPKTNKTK